MKECYEELDVESNQFMDTLEVDVQGHSCLWYAQMKTAYPQICASSNARRMCPVTCQAKQVCFSRRKKRATAEQQDVDKPPLLPKGDADTSVYRIFDRVMHLRPEDSAHPTIICPRSSINKDILVQECKKCQGPDTSACSLKNYTDLPEWHFSLMYNASWSGYNRANILDCDELAARVDSAQCAWNDTWVKPFTDEFKKTNAFSVSFWTKPAPTSRGMPGEFVSSVNFFSKLVTPKTFFDLQHAHPYEEAISRVDMANVVAEGWDIPGEDVELYAETKFNFKLQPRTIVELNHGGAVPFNSEWTFYHVSFQQNHVDRWQHVPTLPPFGPPPRFLGKLRSKLSSSGAGHVC